MAGSSLAASSSSGKIAFVSIALGQASGKAIEFVLAASAADDVGSRRIWLARKNMAIQLSSPKANALARKLAAATGEDIETAVERAIEERLARVPKRRSRRLRAGVEAIFDRLARMRVLDARPAEEIIGFDPHGVPS
jgi:antitoxin VapB